MDFLADNKCFNNHSLYSPFIFERPLTEALGKGKNHSIDNKERLLWIKEILGLPFAQ